MAEGHEVHVFCRSVEDASAKDIHWHRISGPRYPHIAEFLGYVLQCQAAVRRSEFDIIHAAGSVYRGADVYGIHNIQPAKRRVLASINGQDDVGFLRRTTREIYLRTTSRYERLCYEKKSGPKPVFLPVSTGVERELRTYYRIGDSPVRVVPNAADTEVFRPVTVGVRNAWRRREGLDEGDVVMAFSGGEWYRKGLDLAIKALALVKEPRLRLLVLGLDDAQPRFEQLAIESGVGDKVVFAGFRRDVQVGLAAADLFLFPSRYEAFSIATLEAAACGLPIIAARINGTEDFIKPGVNGEFIEHDSEKIARTLCFLLSAPDRLVKMGVAARASVEKEYTWDRVAQITRDCYDEILKNRRPLAPAVENICSKKRSKLILKRR
jgi:glycosyltransferase involved in cell wall biosynthesis